MSPEDLLIFLRYGIKSYDNVKNPDFSHFLPSDDKFTIQHPIVEN